QHVASGVSRPALRTRLAMEGYIGDTAATVRNVSNAVATHAPPAAPVAAAVKDFQGRHGLQPTGTLNAATLTELNVPVENRVKQIGLNLERYRWLPRSLGARYVYVNVPAFRLDAYDSGRKVLSMKVVVGAEYQGKNTPVFSDTMKTVVF